MSFVALFAAWAALHLLLLLPGEAHPRPGDVPIVREFRPFLHPVDGSSSVEWSVTVGENMARTHPAIGHEEPAASEPKGK
jgi:hypothetical protein